MSKDNKKSKVLEKKRKSFFSVGNLIPFVFILMIVGFKYIPRGDDGDINFGNKLVSYKQLKAENGKVSIPLKDVDSGEAKYFSYKFPDKKVNFFVVKSTDGVIRAAFDACDVCFRSRLGYKQNGDVMVCNNCGQVFPTNRINIEKGGCNPAPLNRTIEGDDLVINVTDINTGKRFF